jgi:AraC-like DNA-binding protein
MFMPNKLNVFFDEKVQRLIDSFTYCFKVETTIFSPEMEELMVGLQKNGSPYCKLIQHKLGFRYRCLRLNKLMCEHCAEKNKLITYQCHAGCSEVIIPIEVESKIIGYAMLGQFRSNTKPPHDILQEWKKHHFDPAELQEAYNNRPFFDKESAKNMLDLFSMLIEFIINRDYVRIRHQTLAENVMKWIDQHIGEQLELDKAAAELNRSSSAIYQAVKKQLGMSFKQLCIMKKIQKFEDFISAQPDISIKSAAAQVGYEDSLYFSRLYRKVRHTSPSNYIKSLQGRNIE